MRRLSLTMALATASTTALADVRSDMLGRWTTGFMTIEDGFVNYRQTYEFGEQSIQHSLDVLVNHPLGQLGDRTQLRGHYELGAPSTTVPGATEIDIHFTQVILTPLHQTSVDDYNEDRACGISDWRLGQPRDVTGLPCEDIDSAPLDLYTIVKVVADDRLEWGLLPEDDDTIGTSPDRRPTSLDPEIIPRNGTGGPGTPDAADVLPGVYDVTSFARNPSGCAESGLVAATPRFGSFELYANRSIIPLMVGWSFQECADAAACRAMPNQIILDTDFPIHELLRAGYYQGRVTETSWTGRCEVRVTDGSTTRAEDGSLEIRTERRAGTIAVASQEECDSHHPAVETGISALACVGAERLTSRLAP